MSARVAKLPTLPTSDAVRNGRPVSGRDMANVARGINWCNGRGCTLVPYYAPMTHIVQGTSVEYDFQLYSRVTAIARIWVFRMHRDVSGFVAGITDYAIVTLPDGVARRVDIRSSSSRQQPVFLIEPIAFPVIGPESVGVTIEANAGEATDLIVEGIACYELPRTELGKNATELGVDVETCRAGEPIFAGVGESLGGVVAAVNGLTSRVWRGAVHVWSVPLADALTTAVTSFAAIFDGEPIVLPAKRGRTDTTRIVDVAILAFASAGTTSGEVRFTGRLGGSATLAIPLLTTTPLWIFGNLEIDCEDVTTTDGRQSGADESIAIEWRRTAGAGTIGLMAIEIGDA